MVDLTEVAEMALRAHGAFTAGEYFKMQQDSGLTVAEFAHLAGITPRALHDIQAGDCKPHKTTEISLIRAYAERLLEEEKLFNALKEEALSRYPFQIEISEFPGIRNPRRKWLTKLIAYANESTLNLIERERRLHEMGVAELRQYFETQRKNLTDELCNQGLRPADLPYQEAISNLEVSILQEEAELIGEKSAFDLYEIPNPNQ